MAPTATIAANPAPTQRPRGRPRQHRGKWAARHHPAPNWGECRTTLIARKAAHENQLALGHRITAGLKHTLSELHRPVQHWLPDVQGRPTSRQQMPVGQAPLQQSLMFVQGVPSS